MKSLSWKVTEPDARFPSQLASLSTELYGNKIPGPVSGEFITYRKTEKILSTGSEKLLILVLALIQLPAIYGVLTMCRPRS